MNQSKSLNLDAIFNTAAAGMDGAYNVLGAAMNGMQNMKDAWATNNSDSRRNMCAQPGYPQGGYSVPARCPYPYADDSYQNPFGSAYGAPSYMQPPVPQGYYGFTDQSYGMAGYDNSQYPSFGNFGSSTFDNGGWWQR